MNVIWLLLTLWFIARLFWILWFNRLRSLIERLSYWTAIFTRRAILILVFYFYYAAIFEKWGFRIFLFIFYNFLLEKIWVIEGHTLNRLIIFSAAYWLISVYSIVPENRIFFFFLNFFIFIQILSILKCIYQMFYIMNCA